MRGRLRDRGCDAASAPRSRGGKVHGRWITLAAKINLNTPKSQVAEMDEESRKFRCRVALRRGLPRRLGGAGSMTTCGGGVAWIRGGGAMPAACSRAAAQPSACVRTVHVLPPLSMVACCKRSRSRSTSPHPGRNPALISINRWVRLNEQNYWQHVYGAKTRFSQQRPRDHRLATTMTGLIIKDRQR